MQSNVINRKCGSCILGLFLTLWTGSIPLLCACFIDCMPEAGKPKSTDWVLESPLFPKWKHCLEAGSEVENVLSPCTGNNSLFLAAMIAEGQGLLPSFVLRRGWLWDICFVVINQSSCSVALEPTVRAQFPSLCISAEAAWFWSQQLGQRLPQSSSSGSQQV